MNILSLRKSHIDAVVELSREFEEYLGSISDEPREDFDIKKEGEFLLKYAFGKEKSFSGYIVKNGDEIIAFALYHYGFDPYSFRGKCIYLISFFVSQKTRGQGVGTSLLEKLQSHDDSVGLFFPVWIRNKGAIEFYQKLGADWIEDVPYMKLMK